MLPLLKVRKLVVEVEPLLKSALFIVVEHGTMAVMESIIRNVLHVEQNMVVKTILEDHGIMEMMENTTKNVRHVE